jgi:hypothetical protein
MKRDERVKVVNGYIVKATIEDGRGKRIAQVSPRRYHARAAAEKFVELCSAQYPDAYVTESMGYDDLTHQKITS